MRAEAWMALAYGLLGVSAVLVLFCGIQAGVLATVAGVACLAGVDA